MRRKKGFTLIELIIVLTLLGITFVLVYPYFGRFSQSVELKAAAKKVSAILRYYRSEAVQKGRVYRVILDIDLREIRVQPMETEEEKAVAEKGEGKSFELKEKFPLPEGIQVKEMKIASTQYPSDLPVIEFYPNGGSNGGSFILDRDNLKGYRIQIHFLTGIVEIREG